MRNLSDAIEMVYVCNNASWAIGEIANAADKEVRPPTFFRLLFRLLLVLIFVCVLLFFPRSVVGSSSVWYFVCSELWYLACSFRAGRWSVTRRVEKHTTLQGSSLLLLLYLCANPLPAKSQFFSVSILSRPNLSCR